MIASHKVNFSTLAIETYGGLGKETVQFIHKIAQFAHSTRTTYTESEFIRNLTSEIAIAVQMGNAHCALNYAKSYCPKIR